MWKILSIISHLSTEIKFLGGFDLIWSYRGFSSFLLVGFGYSGDGPGVGDGGVTGGCGGARPQRCDELVGPN